ncbi:MAG: M28 family peptidase [Bacteroidetes bacterium]|nr:MAG: M28 family peptidase [Bacteroidota bacterium]
MNFTSRLASRLLSILTLVFFLVLSACSSSEKDKQQSETIIPASESLPVITVPVFNEDTAYAFVKAQCDFGPRVPGTTAHKNCADYLVDILKRYTPSVMVQEGKVSTYDGVNLDLKNIIAAFNPESKNRILLFAHWDTRPWADHGSERKSEPNLGADDGASGVAVLLEIARQFSLQSPSVGVDIIFFDVEDWGKSGGGAESEDSYCLGTQYWTKNLHVPGYLANYGILLDMVGGRNSKFRLEGNSKQFAPHILDKVWKTGVNLGYSSYFLFQDGGWITDDHVYVNRINIPSIDIIGSDAGSVTGFPAHWHTHEDNMDVIDKGTLKAVGQTVLHVVYSEQGI